MDSRSSTTAVNKASGLPRPTRLPVLASTGSRLPLPRQQSASGSSATGVETITTPQKPPVSAYARPKPPQTHRSVPQKAHAPIGAVKSSSRATSRNRDSNLRPASRTNQSNAIGPIVRAQAGSELEETHDQLSALDSFRSASRQSSYEEAAPVASEYVAAPASSETTRERKPSRPSLSDRTIGSIQNLPATPKDRRRSSFFSPVESPMGPPPRPTSGMSRNGSSGGSRPTTSDGNFIKPSAQPRSMIKPSPASAKPTSRTSSGVPRTTSTRRSLSSAFQREARDQSSFPQTVQAPTTGTRTSNAPRLSASTGVKVIAGSKTVAVRPSQSRPSLSDAFGLAVNEESGRVGTAKSKAATSRISLPAATSDDLTPSKKSSAALRQQIAAAKAAARKEKAKHDSPQSSFMVKDDDFHLEAHNDPFNQAPRDEKHMLRNRVNAARRDGRLNIAAMGLKEIPSEVLAMYDPAALQECRISWAEVADLTRMNAADNEIADLPDHAFPDRSARESFATDDGTASLFAAVEVLDLHGNLIPALPIGMRQLERLTSLNLSHNKLDNSALDVIIQISTLKDLKLGHNALSGSLTSLICQLSRLESLDVRYNRLLSLPDALRELFNLRVLNVSGNQLTALPVDALQDVPLTELDASNNALIASLFPVGTPSSHSTLQNLNVANNSLAALTFDEELELPRLHTLDITCNNFTSLPPVTNWVELVTILAADNKIPELPLGFTSLPKLRNVNLTGNEFRSLDPEIGRMQSLESLVLASNPLRDRKFISMATADVKRNLLARLAPAEGGDRRLSDQIGVAEDVTGETSSNFPPAWVLKAHDSLDLSSQDLADNVNDDLERFLSSNTIKRLSLNANSLTGFPLALSSALDLRILDLSGNALGVQYLSTDLTLPSLEELNLSRCTLSSVEPLKTHVHAPRLHSLTLSTNRLVGALPMFRSAFPSLVNLMASENKFTSMTAEALRGLRVVNLSGNDIEYLPPEVGLLWDGEGNGGGEGLRSLDVSRNAFRVPNYRVLEKGTEALMRWLKDKLPAREG